MSSVTKEGWVTKRGGTFKTWKKRWFVLQGNVISYYENKPNKKLKGTIELTDDCGAEIATKADCRRQPSFKIRVPAVRTYYVVAESEVERKAWVDIINKTIENGKSEAAKSSDPEAPKPKPVEKPGKRVNLDSFDILKVLGRGTYGKVQLVRSKIDGKIYAMKTMSKRLLEETEQIDQALTERNILLKTAHSFLVHAHAAFQTKEKIFMILDYVPGGELFGRLKNEGQFSEDRTRLYAAEIMLGLGHLHKQGFVYRDLKPENILLDADGHLKITDFGLVKTNMKNESDTTNTFCGTPEYIAPEMLRQQPYSKSVDWWSFGILVFEMLTGLPPFYDENTHKMYRMIIEDDVVFPGSMSPEAQDLISKLLDKDPAYRLGAGDDDVEEIKRHPFFAPLDWDDVLNRRIQPEWVPEISNELDVSNFDEEFIGQVPGNSFEDDSLLGADVQKNFTNFSFQDSALNDS